jgi:hypothetical protein
MLLFITLIFGCILLSIISVYIVRKYFNDSSQKTLIQMCFICIILNLAIFIYLIYSFKNIKTEQGYQGPIGIKGVKGGMGKPDKCDICGPKSLNSITKYKNEVLVDKHQYLKLPPITDDKELINKLESL